MRHLIDFGDLSRREWDKLYARAGKIMDDPSSTSTSAGAG